MNDTRQIRQAAQTVIGLAMVVLPVALAKPFDWRALVTAILGGIMTLLTNPRLVPGLAGVMPVAGGSTAPQTPSGPRGTGSGTALLVLAFLGLSVSSCHNVTPDQFAGAVVDCAKVNPEASSTLASVETCLIGAVAGNPSVCLTGLVTECHFAIDEIACVVAYVAQRNQDKVAVGQYTMGDLQERQTANNWLGQERISIRNSYSSGR
jgi:hypothetical protein